MGAFGSKKTLKEIIREQKRMVDRSIRQLEREKATLERQEKKLIMEMKKCAGKNQLKSVNIMAKDLVRMRKSQEKFTLLVAQLRGLSLKMMEMASTQALGQAMGQCTRSMAALNRSMNLPALQQTMMTFQRETERMNMKQEMMGDAMDDAMEDEDDEEETDLVVSQVLDEIGIKFDENLVDAPSKQEVKPANEEVEDDELNKRLQNLRR
uniref:Vacuolar protein sorting-associated protein 2 homolog 1 n=1 Tax=Hirondellea gigas TaxID=1518452 RepID=A0A6A7GAH5_9CRUS